MAKVILSILLAAACSAAAGFPLSVQIGLWQQSQYRRPEPPPAPAVPMKAPAAPSAPAYRPDPCPKHYAWNGVAWTATSPTHSEIGSECRK